MYAELNITEKELDIIKNLVSQNQYYAGNEDLFPQICESVYRKSHLLFKSVQNYDYLESYLRKIVNSSIIEVLQHSQRVINSVQSAKSRYLSKSDEANRSDSYSAISENTGLKLKKAYEIYKIDDPCTENDVYAPERSDIERILEFLEVVNSEDVDKKYLQIFASRYIENKTTESIAYDLGLSESEVNRRLLNLAEIIEENF